MPKLSLNAQRAILIAWAIFVVFAFGNHYGGWQLLGVYSRIAVGLSILVSPLLWLFFGSSLPKLGVETKRDGSQVDERARLPSWIWILVAVVSGSLAIPSSVSAFMEFHWFDGYDGLVCSISDFVLIVAIFGLRREWARAR